MAEIDVTCPECGNRRGVPDDLVGKKIKCKKCQSVFTVKAPVKASKPAPPKPAAPAKPAAKPPQTEAPPNVFSIKKEEEKEDRNPYVMREENLAARCPFCAMLLDPPDAKICLHCGYDMHKRKRVERKIVYHTTAGDYILWHLSTFACMVVFGIVVGVCVFCFINLPDWWSGDAADILPASCFQTWLVIMTLFICWFTGRFVFRKLVWRFHPPEAEKKKGDDEDEEYEYYDDDDDEDEDDDD
jgi:hypothetical protein